MKKILVLIYMLLMLCSCNYRLANDNFFISDVVEEIAEDNNYVNYVFTYQPVENEENTFIITFYIRGIRYITATYIAYLDEKNNIYWEVISIE